MTLRTKIVLWFVILHLVFAAAAVFVLMEQPWLLFAVEVCFAVSVLISYRLVNALFVPLDLIRTGAELIGERDFTSRFVPVGQPEMDHLIAVYNQMIDRLREERLATEEQHQLLQKIVQASPAGIVIFGFDGAVQQANPAAERLLADARVAEALPQVAPGESRLLHLGGARRLRVQRAEFRDRGFLKSFVLLEELTEELRLTEKAAYEKLIRMMSHEVNNSVGTVRSLLESLLRYRDQIAADDRDDFSTAVSVSSSRMDALNRFMSGFADVVRLPPPALRETDLAEVLEQLAALMRPELEARNIALRTDIARDGAVRVDRSQIEQVVLNILRNAVESIDRDGAIELRWRDRVLSIADSGRGIDEQARDELFTPFFTTKREGRGLGLTIVQEILTNHHLPFALQNRAGGGAEFRIDFGQGS
jgi:two-component system, NtrC family, nitrogen regulation sensor histidine kinase NtrY